MSAHLKANLFWILIVFLALGWFYPAIGVAALVCMLAPVALAPFRGRYWCGNFCPRGSFYDRIVAKFSPQRPVPAIFRSKAFRIMMVITIMTVFSFQTYYAWGDAAAVGMVFLRLILITTIVGIVLGLIYHHRTWCAFCPMGTMANWFSGPKMPLNIEHNCVSCGLCAKACPMGLVPHSAKGAAFSHGDCLKCGQCIPVCPKAAIAFDPPAPSR